MSGFLKTIKEYTEVVINGIKNGDKIIEALIIGAKARNETIDPESLAEILRRKDICASCPFNSDNAKKEGLYRSSLDYQHCILCQCRIGGGDTKEYCLSCTCGAQAFNEANPHLKPIEVKWKPFEIKTKEQ
jgi:hypothetical protein